MAITASSWPNDLALEFVFHGKELGSFLLLHARERHTGPLETTCMISSSVTRTSFSPLLTRHSERMASRRSLACFSLSRKAAAFWKSCALMAAFLLAADPLDVRFDVLDVQADGHRRDMWRAIRLRPSHRSALSGGNGRQIAVGKPWRAASTRLVHDLGFVMGLSFRTNYT